jgi:HEAT repeat protein
MKKHLFRFTPLVIVLLFCAPTFAQQNGVPSPDSLKGDATPAALRVQEMLGLLNVRTPEAKEKIKQSLGDDNWYVRGTAARILAEMGDPTASQAVLPLLKDDNWYVRESALAALATMKASADAVTLDAMFASPDPYARARAARAAGAMNAASTVDSLIRLLKDDDEMVRRAAIVALGDLKADKSADAILPALQSDSPGLRKAAAVALGKIGYKGAWGAIAAVSKTSEDWEYAAALYRLGHRDALEAVTTALHSPYQDVRSSALRDLLDFADNRALPSLLEFASPPSGPASVKLNANEALSYRLLIAEGLARFSGKEAQAALIKLIEDPAPRVRSAAAISLVRVSRANPKDDEAITALVAALQREKLPPVQTTLIESLASFDRPHVASLLLKTRGDGKLSEILLQALAAMDVTADSLITQLGSGEIASRTLAADRLAMLGDPKAVPPLIEALTTAKEAPVRASAAAALGTLKDRRAVDALMTASNSPDRDVRLAAVTSLGLIADHTSSEALLVAAKDADQSVRNAALVSLAALGISVERLSADITHPNWQTRAAAIAMLARLGDAKSLPLLVGALKDNDSRVRVEAARTIGLMGEPRAMDALVAAVGDTSADVRVEATVALGRLKDARAIAPLTSLLNDRDARVSLAAAESLARMQDARAIRVLVTSLADGDWQVRARAAQVLARVSADAPIEEATAQLAKAVTDKDPVVRYYAAEALTGIGAKAVMPLIETLRTPRDQDRERAARVLWRIGKPAVEPLIAFIQDRSLKPEMRAVAAHALGVIGDARATKPLLQLLRDERYFVREQAAFALGQMGNGAVEAILEMANASQPATREAAIEALGRFDLPQALARINEATTDANASVRTAAVKALGQTGSERAVAPLMALLRDESSAMRAQAATSLAKLGDVALPSLTGALKDNRPLVRQLAAEALGDIGSKQAVQPLLDLVASDSSGARAEAVEALGKIGDPSAIPAILGATRTGSMAVRKRGVAALARFRDPRAVDALVASLNDRDEEVRQSAASGLAEVGDARVISPLEKVADADPSSDVRAAAATAIQRIRAQSRAPQDKAAEPKGTRQ